VFDVRRHAAITHHGVIGRRREFQIIAAVVNAQAESGRQ